MIIATRLRSTLGMLMWALLVVLPGAVRAKDISFTGHSEPPGQPLALWYSRPARQWLEALPVGNGRLGAMVHGGVLAERIQMNEGTLWSGGPKDGNNPDALKTLPEIRAQILKGDFAQAQKLGKKMQGPYTQSYMPMSDLQLAFDTPAAAGEFSVNDYRRMLDLDRGVAGVEYTMGDVHYAREVFVSHPDHVMVVRLTASQPRRLSFSARLGSKLHFRTQARDGVLVVAGKAPANVDPNYYGRPNPIVYASDEHGEGMTFCHATSSLIAKSRHPV